MPSPVPPGPDGGDGGEESPAVIEPKFPEYWLPGEELIENTVFRGSASIIVGYSGMLFQNGYINEYFGYAPKYVNCTDEQLLDRVLALKHLQDMLEEAGKAMCVAISLNNAAYYPEYVPDWYHAKFTPPVNYVRPYERFRKMLHEHGVYFVDAQEVCASVGLTNTFAKTGVHWNKLSSWETTCAVIAEYERQRGYEIRNLKADRILSSPNPPGFGNPERDIYNIVTSGQNRSVIESMMVDDLYYWPDVYVDDMSKPQMGPVVIQGGSFEHDFTHYLSSFAITPKVTSFFYNNNGNPRAVNFDVLIPPMDFLLLEVNEQFVYGMGGNAPSWGDNDFNDPTEGIKNNFIDLLIEWMEAARAAGGGRF